ncbi:hypothetical protein WJX84_000915 [Apatococcus fuscideae]|uniref:Cilia- and flagella-associated protein 299 n=1 Tax=Apatococcus fuscideae TaxID=2026836 RepID=A0AAW1SMT4_9CHLO
MGAQDDLELYGAGADPIIDENETYEDYLDKQITPTDLFYLEDLELARQLVDLGYHGNEEILPREEFEARKKAAEELRASRLTKKTHKLAHMGKDLIGYPLLQALAEREENVRNGRLTTIIFIRDRNARGQEISGYIDYAHRLKQDNMEAVFSRKRRLLPKTTDVSFYNWETQVCSSKDSATFQVLADESAGLLFKNKRDRKIVNVDPQAHPGDNSSRTEIATSEYLQVIIYDHISRRRG